MMKRLLFGLFFSAASFAQPCITPPPLGMNPIFAFDADHDGLAIFDIGYYIENQLRPNLEQIHGVSTSGYDFVFQGPEGPISPAPMYQSIEANEIREIAFEYSGSGPTLDPVPPCFWDVLLFDTVILYAVAPEGDFDGDGIANLLEDTNDNGNLNDDDDDADGLINIMDVTNALGLPVVSFRNLTVSPNPVTDGFFNVDGVVGMSVSLYDALGRAVLTIPNTGNQIDVAHLPPGIYLARFTVAGAASTRKIIIE